LQVIQFAVNEEDMKKTLVDMHCEVKLFNKFHWVDLKYGT